MSFLGASSCIQPSFTCWHTRCWRVSKRLRCACHGTWSHGSGTFPSSALPGPSTLSLLLAGEASNPLSSVQPMEQLQALVSPGPVGTHLEHVPIMITVPVPSSLALPWHCRGSRDRIVEGVSPVQLCPRILPSNWGPLPAHSTAVGIGFYGNSETNDGVYQLLYALDHANHTLTGIDTLVGLRGRVLPV